MNRDDQVGGSGILQALTSGAELPVCDLVTLMIVVSDNTAANMLLARNQVVSLRACEAMGRILKRQQYHDHLTRQQYHDHLTKYLPPGPAPARTAGGPERVAARAVRSTGALPKLEVAHKNGWIEGARACAGIF